MNTRSLVSGAMMLALYFVFLILYMNGLFSSLLTFALPLPFIIYYERTKKLRDTGWLLLAACIGSVLITSFYGLLTTVCHGLIGLTVVYGSHKKWSHWVKVFNASLVYAALLPIVTQLTTGLSIQDSLMQIFQESLDMMASMPSLNNEQAIKQLESFSTVLPYIVPSLLLFSGLLQVILSLKLSDVILKRMHINRIQESTGSTYKLTKEVVYILLITQIASLVSINEWMNMIILNIVLILNVLFIIQGCVVMVTYFTARKKRLFGIMIVMFALLSGLGMVALMIGVLDAFYDFRNKIRNSETGGEIVVEEV